MWECDSKLLNEKYPGNRKEKVLISSSPMTASAAVTDIVAIHLFHIPMPWYARA